MLYLDAYSIQQYHVFALRQHDITPDLESHSPFPKLRLVRPRGHSISPLSYRSMLGLLLSMLS